MIEVEVGKLGARMFWEAQGYEGQVAHKRERERRTRRVLEGREREDENRRDGAWLRDF